MTNKKTFIAIGLTGVLFVSVLIGISAGTTLPIRLLANNEPQYSCYGNVRIETGEDGNYVVTHIGSDATSVEIPSTIDGVPVTSISSEAFEDCKGNLTSVTIDTSINIEDGTFNNCPNELDITFTGDATELNYGAIFENTTIGTMTIPSTVTYVSPETFYGVTDTTTLVYEGSFENFWNGVFPNLWNAFNTTLKSDSYTTASMPTNIVVNGVTYYIPDGTSYFGLNRDNTTYHAYYFPEGSRPSTNQITKRCSFGVNNTTYYNNI